MFEEYKHMKVIKKKSTWLDEELKKWRNFLWADDDVCIGSAILWGTCLWASN